MVYKYFVSVCLCVKNEAKYIEEFIKHYIDQGVDHFYIINNNSNDNIEEVIDKSGYKLNVTLITDNRDMNILKSDAGHLGHQQLINDNLYDIIKEETEWAILVDADEFMYGKNGHTIKSYLSSIDENIGCIYVIWNIINPYKDENNNLISESSIKNNSPLLSAFILVVPFTSNLYAGVIVPIPTLPFEFITIRVAIAPPPNVLSYI
jgi:glycosyltransferase involved in cell wall biosynthesis